MSEQRKRKRKRSRRAGGTVAKDDRERAAEGCGRRTANIVCEREEQQRAQLFGHQNRPECIRRNRDDLSPEVRRGDSALVQMWQRRAQSWRRCGRGECAHRQGVVRLALRLQPLALVEGRQVRRRHLAVGMQKVRPICLGCCKVCASDKRTSSRQRQMAAMGRKGAKDRRQTTGKRRGPTASTNRASAPPLLRARGGVRRGRVALEGTCAVRDEPEPFRTSLSSRDTPH